MDDQDALLIVFVKHPTPGQTKTRLAAGIGHEKALAIYRELLQDLRQEAGLIDADVAIFYGNEIPQTDLWSETGWPRVQQQGEELGQRMQHAFAWGFTRGYRRIVLVGSDIPGVTHQLLQEVFGQLGRVPAAIGPAKDGGYYLIGLNRPFDPVFHGKAWSTETVCSDTLKDLELAGLDWYTAPMLSDVDTVTDLAGTRWAHLMPDPPNS